jgi:accessory gene regulator protein AgrB
MKVSIPKKSKPRQIIRDKSRMPENSVFYERVVPGLLIMLGIIMVILILFAAGILVGIVPFR